MIVSTASAWQKNSRRPRSSRHQWRSSFFVVSLAFSQPEARHRRTSSRSAFTSGRSSRSSSANSDICALPVRSVLNQ
jgi:hypothetical protein